MICLKRLILPLIYKTLKRDKSILLLGARQTGKTTLVSEFLQPTISFSLAKLETKLRYEKNPRQFEKDLEYELSHHEQKPLIFIDEIQKLPILMDSIQYLIDTKKLQFVLSGSSARKLKYGPSINLLSGRVVNVMMDTLTYDELPTQKKQLDDLLIYGSLPSCYAALMRRS